MEQQQRLARWRLVMGADAEGECGTLDHENALRDMCLDYLYSREYGDHRNVRGGHPGESRRRGTLDPSQLTVPEWINHIHELFPRQTIERLEKDALERYLLEEIVTNPEALRRAQPSQSLLKAVLRTRHLMNQEVLDLARELVRKMIEELAQRLALTVQLPFQGVIDRRRRSAVRISRNFDVATTLRRNLKHYDPQRKRIVIETPYFHSRVRRQADRWQIVLLVDQSASMLGSVIHAAVTASIFFGIPALRTHLCVFDTQIVELTDFCTDPVATLMQVQLGGGTDIAQALQYAASLVDVPRQCLVILITDFEDGGELKHLLGVSKELIESGVTLLGLAALDEQAAPSYNRDVAARLVQLGAHVGAMTPGELAVWIADKVG